MEKFKDISVSIKQHLAYVEINRPPNNFFDANLIQQIADAYESLDEEDECRVILLKSEGKNFCAGANFGQDEDMLDKSVPYKKLYAQAVRLFRTRKPVIAIVQGAAIGGGLGLALSADFRVACHEARFAANFAKLGFHPGFGSLLLFLELLAYKRPWICFLQQEELQERRLLRLVWQINFALKKNY